MIPEAERWFNQAKKDLEAASWNLEGKFSFNKARKLLESYMGSLSEAIIEERRSAV